MSVGQQSSLHEDSKYFFLLEKWQNQEDKQEVWELQGETSSLMHNSGAVNWILY